MLVNRISTIALSMFSNKGAYAILCGAGISRSAGIKTGWHIEEDLIRKIAATQGVTDAKDWHEWYKEYYGKNASYSSLLADVVTTATERVQLMKQYFEATEEEKEDGLKQPTKAHESIAKLAKSGYIRVVVSPNFDRLFEMAFQKEGVKYQVVYHADDLNKITPLVHSGVTIVKLNGDYLDCRFRNTEEELDSYQPEMETFLMRIFEDFGIITTGWSAQWDKGLIEIIKKSRPSRYGSFFTYVGKLGDSLNDIADNRKGEKICIDSADCFFSDLYGQICALDNLSSSNNITKEIFVRRVKKFISTRNDMELIQLLEEEAMRAQDQILQYSNYNFEVTPVLFNQYRDIHIEASDKLIASAIEIVRWGKDEQLLSLIEIIKRLAYKPFRNGEICQKNTSYLHLLAAKFLFNAIGIACVKFRRFGTLNHFFTAKTPAKGYFNIYQPVNMVYLIGYDHWGREILNGYMGQNYYCPMSALLCNVLKPYFEDSFLCEDDYEETYYMWEQLFSLLFAFYGCDIFAANREFYPIGFFLRQRVEYDMFEGCEYREFFRSADTMQDNWEPILQGLFDGKYEKYKTCKDKAEKFYKDYCALYL